MKYVYRYAIVLGWLLMLMATPVRADQWQGWSGALVSLGHNYISGAYGQAIGVTDWNNGSIYLSLATGLVGKSVDNQVTFAGLTAQAAYRLPIRHFPWEFRLMYNFSPHWDSTIMEHDLALLGSYQGRHLATGLGYQVRFNHSLDGTTRYVEYENYIYYFELFVWPQGHKYNLSGAVKNFDILNYGLDPLLAVSFYYTLPGKQRFIFEFLYQGAGVGPILFNHYDVKIRLGVLWGG